MGRRIITVGDPTEQQAATTDPWTPAAAQANRDAQIGLAQDLAPQYSPPPVVDDAAVYDQARADMVADGISPNEVMPNEPEAPPVAPVSPAMQMLAQQQAAAAARSGRWQRDVARYKDMKRATIEREAAHARALQDAEASRIEEEAAARVALDNERRRIMGEAQARVAQERARAEELSRRMPELRDYWADKSTGTRVAAAIAVGLGAAGGGGNEALDILNSAMARDFQIQRQRIDAMKDRVAMARTGIDDAEKAKDRLLEDVSLKEAMAMKAVAEKYKAARLRQLGGDEAALARDKALAALELEAAKLAQQHMGGVSLRAIRAAAGAARAAGAPRVTEQQRDKTAFFNAAMPAIETLIKTGGLSPEGAEILYRDTLNQKALDASPIAAPILRGLGLTKTLSEKLSKNDRLAHNAYMRAIDIANKYITGAGQTDQEFRRRFEMNVVQPGDDAETIRAKMEGLIAMLYEHGMQGAAPEQARQQIVDLLHRTQPQPPRPYQPGAPRTTGPTVAPSPGDMPPGAERVGTDRRTGSAVYRLPNGRLIMEDR